ncbi:MAG: DUF4363 family protein [Clostridia bacterium]|nr:DUF4363 family protein [Clostridia bacterium]
MKAFIISLVILVLLCVFVIWSSVFVVNTLDDLKANVEKLEINNSDSFSEIKEEWEKSKYFIAITTPHSKIDDMDKAICVLESKIENDELEGFYEYKAQLLVCIEEIQSHEKVSWDSIS